nr:hypothetical protein OH820_20480 [Streptomyces sp. NBC_00857]
MPLPQDAEDGHLNDPRDGHQPDYPPRTPPPPKRPVQPPRPTAGVATTQRRRVTMANRRGSNWPLESRPWAPARARDHVVGKLHEWGHTDADATVGDVVALLVETVVADGGRRISLHLSDQNRQALVVVLSHQPGLAVTEEAVLPRIAALGATSCGADTAEDGRRLWAVLDL